VENIKEFDKKLSVFGLTIDRQFLFRLLAAVATAVVSMGTRALIHTAFWKSLLGEYGDSARTPTSESM